VTSPTRTFQTKQMIMSQKRVENVLVTASEDNKLRVWGLNKREGDILLVKTWHGHQKGVPTSFANFQNLLYTSSLRDQDIRTWDLLTLERGPDFEGHTLAITDIAIDTHTIKTPSLWSGSFDKTVKAWDGISGKCVSTLEGHTDGITAIKVIGNSVISASSDKTVRIWDKRKMLQVSVLQGHTAAVTGICIFREKAIISFGRDGAVNSWKLKNGELNFKIDTGYPIVKLKLTKKYISTMGGHALEIYSKKGKKIHTLQAHTNHVTAQKFYDEEYLFSGSDDRTVRLWNVKTGEQMSVYRGHHGTVSGIQFWGAWMYSSSHDCSIMQWKNHVFAGMDEGERWM